MLCGILVTWPFTITMSQLSGKVNNLRGINYAVRTGGILFGLFYAKYGNALWERSKQIFYERDLRIQNAISGNLI